MSQEDIYVLMLKEEGIPHSGKHGSDTTFFTVCVAPIKFSSVQIKFLSITLTKTIAVIFENVLSAAF